MLYEVITPRIVQHPKRLQDYSRIITDQTQRLSAQVEKLLHMATIEKRKIELQTEPVNS